MLFPSEKIYGAKSLVVPAERGVFAKIAIKKDELIESCPMLIISTDDTAEIAEESLVTYMFYYGENKEKSCIALGFGSLYNHSKDNNAHYIIKPDKHIIEFWATKNIQKNEEITVRYVSKENGSLWFEK